MSLARVVRTECIELHLSVTSKEEALREVARVAKKCPVLRDVNEQLLLRSLKEREKTASTGVGKGIALPHCRLEGVQDFVVGILGVPGGVDFEAVDGERVRLIVFIVGPTEAAQESHIRILSWISQMFSQPRMVDSVLSENSAAGVQAQFLKHGQRRLRSATAHNLFHVFVQEEEVFDEILQIFTGCGSSSVVVIEAQNGSAYLARMPLFADFWSTGVHEFSRIIVAVVDGQMTNEVVRRIEDFNVGARERHHVLVTVQKLLYTSGVLSI